MVLPPMCQEIRAIVINNCYTFSNRNPIIPVNTVLFYVSLLNCESPHLKSQPSDLECLEISNIPNLPNINPSMDQGWTIATASTDTYFMSHMYYVCNGLK